MKTNKQRWSRMERAPEEGGRKGGKKRHFALCTTVQNLLSDCGRVVRFRFSVPAKTSVAVACCRVSERGHASPCASGCDADVCPPADSLQPATTDSRGPRQEQPMEREQHGTGERHFQERTTATAHLTRRLLPNAGLPHCWSVCARVCVPRVAQHQFLPPLQPQLAGWLADSPQTHTQVNSPHTQPVHRLTQCTESGSGVTSRCLSGSGPRPRRLAPPLPTRHSPPPPPSPPAPVTVTLQTSRPTSLESNPRHYSSLIQEAEEENNIETMSFTGRKSQRWKKVK